MCDQHSHQNGQNKYTYSEMNYIYNDNLHTVGIPHQLVIILMW